jgi:hypothetical protein
MALQFCNDKTCPVWVRMTMSMVAAIVENSVDAPKMLKIENCYGICSATPLCYIHLKKLLTSKIYASHV